MKDSVKEEFDALRNAIESVFYVSILENSRLREVVNARMTFAKILVDKGYTKVGIGRYLGRDHATIIHYCKNFDGYIKVDKVLRNQYEKAKDIFFGQHDPLYDMATKQLRETAIAMRKELEDKDKQIEEIKELLKIARREGDRLDSIYKMLVKRLPQGREEEVELKIQTYLNGIHGR